MSAPGAHAEITETSAGLKIEIGPVRHWVVGPAIASFLVLWGWAEYHALGFFSDLCVDPASGGRWAMTGVGFFALALWSFAGYLMIREFIWLAMATETVSVGAGLLRIRKEAPIFRTAQEFDLSAVRDLHLAEADGSLRFRSGERDWVFGRTLLAEEAERVLERIRGRFGSIAREAADTRG